MSRINIGDTIGNGRNKWKISVLSTYAGIAVNLDNDYPYVYFSHLDGLVYHIKTYKNISDAHQQFALSVLKLTPKYKNK